MYKFYLSSGPEENFANEEHVAFTDGPGTGARIRSRTKCTGDSDGDVTCTFPSSIAEASEDNHATGVLGIIMGDAYDDSTLWISRRGVATEAEAHLYAANTVSAVVRAYDYVQSATPTPYVLNQSSDSSTHDTGCSGTTGYSRALNNIYETGILPVAIAGNSGHVSLTDCTVNGPGSALGAVTVASLGDDQLDDTVAELRAASVSPWSARGGTSSQGGGRAIIDLAAVGVRANMMGVAANSGPSAYAYSSIGTSFAAPYVSGAALLLVDWSVRDHAGFLEYNPGLLHAMLILMTDRWGTNAGGSYRLQGTKDNLYGAGRLRMRLLNDVGLDNPWGWEAGSTCVEDGRETEIPINGTPIGDIDVLKAAIYFYDPQHETGGGVDSINMYIERADTGVAVRGANMIGNEYQFLAMRQGTDALQNVPLRLVLNGLGVPTDNSGCGTNQMLVHYAYFYEDSDRESAEGLGDGSCLNELDCVAKELQ